MVPTRDASGLFRGTVWRTLHPRVGRRAFPSPSPGGGHCLGLVLLPSGGLPQIACLTPSFASRRSAAGLPTLAQLFEEALAMPVEVILCQSGLAMAGMDVGQLDPRISTGGLIGVVAAAGDDRLVLA